MVAAIAWSTQRTDLATLGQYVVAQLVRQEDAATEAVSYLDVAVWARWPTTSPPAFTHSANSGVYYVQFPNAPLTELSVTPDTPSADCTAANADYAVSGATTVAAVETKDCTNSFADRGFQLVVFATGT